MSSVIMYVNQTRLQESAARVELKNLLSRQFSLIGTFPPYKALMRPVGWHLRRAADTADLHPVSHRLGESPAYLLKYGGSGIPFAFIQ